MKDFFQSLTPPVLSAIIAALVSFVTFVLTSVIKNPLEKNFHLYKLKKEHQYEQIRLIKQTLSKHKTQIINSAEYLNHRLWNLNKNYHKHWHFIGSTPKANQYYFNSFIYRFIRFFAWIKIIDDNIIFLDTTIATKGDLYLIKYLKLFHQLLQDTELLQGLEYDPTFPTDHIYRDNFEEMTQSVIIEDKVISFRKFKDADLKELEPLCNFINGIIPDENRFRWDMLHCFHLTLIAFLNSYGYDFQHTDKNQLVELIKSQSMKCRIYDNYIKILIRNKIDKEESIRMIIKILKDTQNC